MSDSGPHGPLVNQAKLLKQKSTTKNNWIKLTGDRNSICSMAIKDLLRFFFQFRFNSESTKKVDDEIDIGKI